jgi:hypothetical protein
MQTYGCVTDRWQLQSRIKQRPKSQCVRSKRSYNNLDVYLRCNAAWTEPEGICYFLGHLFQFLLTFLDGVPLGGLG